MKKEKCPKRQALGKRSRRKGHAFERWCAIKFRKLFPGARRHLENHVVDANGIDLLNTGEFRVQCKAYANYAPIDRIREIQICPIEGGTPVLVTKGNNKAPVAVLPFDRFLDLIGELQAWRDAARKWDLK